VNKYASFISVASMVKEHFLIQLALVVFVLGFSGVSMAATDNEPLDFSFIKSPPARAIYSIGISSFAC